MHTHETSHLYNLTISSYTLAHPLLVCAIISHNDTPHSPSYSLTPHPHPHTHHTLTHIPVPLPHSLRSNPSPVQSERHQ